MRSRSNGWPLSQDLLPRPSPNPKWNKYIDTRRCVRRRWPGFTSPRWQQRRRPNTRRRIKVLLESSSLIVQPHIYISQTCFSPHPQTCISPHPQIRISPHLQTRISPHPQTHISYHKITIRELWRLLASALLQLLSRGHGKLRSNGHQHYHHHSQHHHSKHPHHHSHLHCQVIKCPNLQFPVLNRI